LEPRSDFDLAAVSDSLRGSVACLISGRPELALADMASEGSLADLREPHQASPGTSLLWGHGWADEFVFQAIQLGIRGLISARTPIGDNLAAPDKVRNGELCFQTTSWRTC
jgi:hypothetical protein